MHCPTSRFSIIFGLLIGLLWGAWGGSAGAAAWPSNVSVVVSPSSGSTLTGNGLRVNIDDSLLVGAGYRLVRVSVSPTVPVIADRTISIELLARRGWMSEGYDMRVVQELDIPAGSGPMSVTISAPPLVAHQYALNISEDGRLLKKLCIPWAMPARSANQIYLPEAIPEILFVGQVLPDTATLAAVLNADKNRPAWQQPPAGAPALQTAAICPPQNLPEQWIDYSGFDIVCISCEQLAALRTARPEAFRALVAWTAAGGNLWVLGVGSDWRRVGELDILLDLPHDAVGDGKSIPPGWKAPENSLFGSELIGVIEPPEPVTTAERAKKKSAAKPPARPPFLLRPLQAGLVVAIVAEKPFPGGKAEWRWLFNSMGEIRWQWCQRHGLSLQRENPEFWNFLIPGVGLAPVKEFCVLISVFVIVIGPVNYWVLRRRRKLHLLLLTIPASAAVVSGLLLGYALLADGLDVRVRARSVTNIDQRSGRAVCWTRLSYCAGLAPRGGLCFPADVAVMPLEQTLPTAYDQRVLSREVVWDEDQHLVSGWLASRTPTQFVTVRARPSGCGLDLLAAGQGKTPSLRNRLETPIKQLVVCAKDGKYYRADAVALAATARLLPISASEAQSRLLGALAEDKLAWPAGMINAPTSSGFRFGIIMNFGMDNTLVQPAQSTGRLEQMRTFCTLAPGSYMAIVERSPEVVLGVPSPREEPSSHVIIGNW